VKLEAGRRTALGFSSIIDLRKEICLNISLSSGNLEIFGFDKDHVRWGDNNRGEAGLQRINEMYY
jgi:hypothetical protein